MPDEEHADTEHEGPLTWGALRPTPNVTFALENRVAFTIHRDGTVELGEAVTLDEAGRAFWEAVASMAPLGWCLSLNDGGDA